MVLILVCFLINALSNNWKVTAGVLVAGAAVLIAFYLRDSSVFANLLPDVLGKFSLLSAFDSFSTDHVFDVPRDPAVPVHQRAAGLSDRPGHPRSAGGTERRRVNMEHRDWKNSLQETAGAPRIPQGRLLRPD